MITILDDSQKVLFNGTEGDLKAYTNEDRARITNKKSEGESIKRANVFAIAKACYKLDDSDY